jgi:hypothetical protein
MKMAKKNLFFIVGIESYRIFLSHSSRGLFTIARINKRREYSCAKKKLARN